MDNPGVAARLRQWLSLKTVIKITMLFSYSRLHQILYIFHFTKCPYSFFATLTGANTCK